MESMKLKPKALENLKQILRKDYGVILSDEEADQFGFSLLKITQHAMAVFNRNEENNLIITN